MSKSKCEVVFSYQPQINLQQKGQVQMLRERQIILRTVPVPRLERELMRQKYKVSPEKMIRDVKHILSYLHQTIPLQAQLLLLLKQLVSIQTIHRRAQEPRLWMELCLRLTKWQHD
jgi:hypothetical protein